MRRTIAELYDLFNDLKRLIHFDKEIETVFRQSEACQRIAKVKCIGLKRPRPLLLLLAKELNLRMVTTLLHGWVWFHASIRVETGGADEYDEKGDKHMRILLFMVPALSSGVPRITMIVI